MERPGSSGQFFGTGPQLQALLAPFFAAGAAPDTLEITTMPYLDATLLWAGCSDALHCRLGDGVGRSRFAAKSDYVAGQLSPGGIAALIQGGGGQGCNAGRGVRARRCVRRRHQSPPEGGHRDASFSLRYVAGWSSASGVAGEQAAVSWLRGTYAAMRPYVSGLACQNYVDRELPHWGLAYYGSSYARLRRVKRQYDPHNVFRFAQSIVPALH